MKRPGQPLEVAKCFLFLASEDSSYLAGQVIHPNGGEVVNGWATRRDWLRAVQALDCLVGAARL
jgi:NAD(P)-dependent dehydrogenase (short-subunit alcohol dehydrogenase family)